MLRSVCLRCETQSQRGPFSNQLNIKFRGDSNRTPNWASQAVAHGAADGAVFEINVVRRGPLNGVVRRKRMHTE